MKKATLLAAALVCATLLIAGTASAQKAKICPPKAQSSLSQTVWAQQSPHPPNPTVRTPVAGYSPNFAAPQPATMATLTPDANRLIRWEGWLDVDAFSVSVLNQMQKTLESGVNTYTGSFDISEPAIAEAVLKAKASDPTFVMNPNLEKDAGAYFEKVSTPTLYVWTYRHNFADKGLYQLYVSVKGKMDIGTALRPWTRDWTVPHNDIQSLNYEFGGDGTGGTAGIEECAVIVDIEIWRGAVVELDATGAIAVVGNLAEVIVNYEGKVEAAPMSDWERAPSLVCNPNYNPKAATGAAFVEPLERAISIRENAIQKQAGDVQKRVNTVTPFRYRYR